MYASFMERMLALSKYAYSLTNQVLQLILQILLHVSRADFVQEPLGVKGVVEAREDFIRVGVLGRWVVLVDYAAVYEELIERGYSPSWALKASTFEMASAITSHSNLLK